MPNWKKGKIHYNKKKRQKGRWVYPNGKKSGKKWRKV